MSDTVGNYRDAESLDACGKNKNRYYFIISLAQQQQI